MWRYRARVVERKETKKKKNCFIREERAREMKRENGNNSLFVPAYIVRTYRHQLYSLNQNSGDTYICIMVS